MAQEKLVFDCLKDNYGGLLSPVDVHLFYYDICFDKESGFSNMYEWSNELQAFLRKNNMLIEPKNTKDIPTVFEQNKCFFSLAPNDRGNKAIAFFRHLRNSFMHYNIGFDGRYYLMKDFDRKTKVQTMIGKIDMNLFHEIINIFFSQKTQFEEKNQ